MIKLKESAAVVVIIMLLSLSVFDGCKVSRYESSGLPAGYENPYWAPQNYYGARYYYLPDIESYYDIYSREFVFLDHAQWIYSPFIPPYYPGFDLNNCFVIVVNSNIYQPWMHHQYYVSHYPRYYYRDYYDHSNIPYVRGYNENSRGAIYWAEQERDRARSWDDANLRNDRQFRYSREDRIRRKNFDNQTVDRQSPADNYGNYNRRSDSGNNTNPAGNSRNDPGNRLPPSDKNNTTQPAGTGTSTRPQPATTTETRRTTETNYYGRPIGQPVKIDRQMRNQTDTGFGTGSSTRTRKTDSENNSGRR